MRVILTMSLIIGVLRAESSRVRHWTRADWAYEQVASSRSRFTAKLEPAIMGLRKTARVDSGLNLLVDTRYHLFEDRRESNMVERRGE